MAISFDKALGGFPGHLSLYGQRSSQLAANIANADTPGFKARDIDFQQALRNALTESNASTDSKVASAGQSATPQLLYRTVVQPSADGNTVDMDVERAHFAENAARYEASLRFLNGQIKGLLAAIQG